MNPVLHMQKQLMLLFIFILEILLEVGLAEEPAVEHADALD